MNAGAMRFWSSCGRKIRSKGGSPCLHVERSMVGKEEEGHTEVDNW